jgi:hypothetical protein
LIDAKLTGQVFIHFFLPALLRNLNGWRNWKTHGVFALRGVFDIIRKTCRFESCPVHKWRR